MKTFPFLAEWHTHGSVILVAKAISTQFSINGLQYEYRLLSTSNT
jgi:hypothetical protein